MKPEKDTNSFAYKLGQFFTTTIVLCGIVIVICITAKILTLMF